ncbi:MAG: hypothetical protein HRT61_07740 [Ekhidna sp.]|nr:hypothetical protein [Ekhidna sp.]
MKTLIYEIPGKMQGHYDTDKKTIIDTWSILNASFEEWKSTIYDVGIMDFVAKNGATTWITDTSNATGVFDKKIQQFREDVSAEAMAKSGIKMFFTVMSGSAIATLSARKTSKAYAGHGNMQSISVGSLEEAFEMRDKELWSSVTEA